MTYLQPLREALRVTDPYMPAPQDFAALMQGVWDRAWLTNEGPLCKELGATLRARLGVPHMQLVSSGSSALQVALAALDVTGDVVTTPYSYAATLNAVLWQGCRPVFADIDRMTMCIDPAQVEDAITPATSAILATHAYGMPCDHEALDDIARRRGVSLIYDAAHAFGCRLDGRSLLSLGDASAVSFHATKVFHTGEGGAVVCADSALDARAALIKAHGVDGDAVLLPGLNARMSEFHCAIGLCVLEAFDRIVSRRRKCFELYRALLADRPLRLLEPEARPAFDWNYAYCPVFFESAEQVERVQTSLASRSIEARRYFRPALNTVAHVSDNAGCPVAEELSDRTLCLPFGSSLTEEQVAMVCDRLSEAL